VVVDVLAGHLPGLGAEVEGLLADGAVRVVADVGGVDGDGGRVVAGVGGGAAGLDLRQLVQQALEAGAHEEVGHALGQRAEAGPDAVVVEELEAGGGEEGETGRGYEGSCRLSFPTRHSR
jgi:hypothetical protein